MEISWNTFYSVIGGLDIAGLIAGYYADKALDKIGEKIKKQSLEEQTVHCLDKALENFCQLEQIEYDMSAVGETFFSEMVRLDTFFTEEFLEDALRKATGLEIGEQQKKNWLFCLKKTISEENVDILYRFLIINGVIRKSSEKEYPHILTAKAAVPPEEYLEREEYETIIKKMEENKRLVLVNGLGGIGKSTVCKKLFQKFVNEEDCTVGWIIYNGQDLKEDFRKQLFFPRDGVNWEKELWNSYSRK